MFTGLIEAVGRVTTAVSGETGGRVTIDTPLAETLAVGDSVAVSGVCLTAVAVAPGAFSADVSPQTCRVTTAADWSVGRRVNLERPLRADARLGGHFVLGHVDGVTHVREVRREADSWWLTFALPAALAELVIPKGSIAVDGISLTIADLSEDAFSVQVIPHTWAVTTLSDRTVGDRVNLEADVLGKHVARLMRLGRERELTS